MGKVRSKGALPAPLERIIFSMEEHSRITATMQEAVALGIRGGGGVECVGVDVFSCRHINFLMM